MISRRTTTLLADLLVLAFNRYHHGGYGHDYHTVDGTSVYDFLFQNSYQAWFCNAARSAASQSSSNTRPFKDFVLRIHTGESLYSATEGWTWEERERLGQELLRNLAQDVANWWGQRSSVAPSGAASTLGAFRESLELDGYVFRGQDLLAPEEDVLDDREEGGVLESLCSELRIPNQPTLFHHLALSGEHYLARRWDDSISNSRKFLEGVLQEAAAVHHLSSEGAAIDEATYSRPARFREYLESAGLLQSKEREALASVYALLSETGGHPYMAQSDQARLLRHLALTFSQFALLRLKGFGRKV